MPPNPPCIWRLAMSCPRVGRKARIEHGVEGRVPVEMSGDRQRRFRRLVYPQEERAHAALEQPGFEGTDDGAALQPDLADAFPEIVLPRRDEGAGDNVAVAVQVLGRRVHDEISTVLDGLRQHGRRDGGVHDECRTRTVCHVRSRGDVDDVPGGIAGRLHPHEARPSRFDGSHQGIRIRRIE